MPEGNQSALYILIGFISVLMLVIFIPLIKMLFTRKKKDLAVEVETKAKHAASPLESPLTEVSRLATPQTLIATPQTLIATPQTLIATPQTLKSALAPTKKNFLGRIQALIGDSSKDSQPLDDIEEVLYTSDLGPQTVQRLMKNVQEQLSRSDKKNMDVIIRALKEEMLSIFSTSEGALKDSSELLSKIKIAEKGPTILMVVGVNGAGKTTSIGKISAQLAQAGKKVLVAAGDTFRAAAGNQLKVWTERAQVEIFSPDGVKDPSAVAFDAVSKAQAQAYDFVIIDTAGRLHTQTNLMEELKKVKRVVGKIIADSPHEILIVLDANSGQNALIQAKEFNQALGLTGAILTKMDGTAKGGVAVGLACELQIPIKWIGIGEKVEDLKAFSSSEFVNSIFDLESGA